MLRTSMPIASIWFQAAILTFIVGFTILGALAYLAYTEQPPIPTRVVVPTGDTIFTREDIMAGMNVFQRYGLMEYGTVYGHGAYLGPDFTAEYLHRSAQFLLTRYEREPAGTMAAPDRVVAELHHNAYDRATGVLNWSATRADAHRMMVDYYEAFFRSATSHGGAQARFIPRSDQVRQLSAFFAWTAWTSAANRPGSAASYTNNWPGEPLAGNSVTADAVTWSVISIIGLLGGTGLVLFLFGRYDWLGWSDTGRAVQFRPVEEVALAPAQRATVWFLLVASILFLLQTFCGGVIAHYRAEPSNFFGFDISRLLSYNVARTWHVQLAIFWVSASYLATGIFIVPLIAGRERRGQARLTILLLGAVAIVIFGSLAGEYAGVNNLIGVRMWYWIGHQGWEYLDLGRVWQILLIAGLSLWVVILARGLKGRLAQEHRGNMPWLLFYTALSLPIFYAVGLLARRDQGFVITDYWRFWVVHLWVEDFLELFTTVVVAYMFVLLGMVRNETATRVIYLDIILYSLGGVVGTMHHLYFSGTPPAHLALGATFSAMEVIPLVLLTLEAWGFMRAGERSALGAHPHKWAIWFLVAVGVWNFFGAGVFGFLINLPVVSYYEIGTNLTANHAHTAMMGVYGMLAIGLLLFCLRYQMRPDKWSDGAAKLCFWSLNLGLTWMAFINLFPIGIVQLHNAVSQGYWHARSLEFIMTPWVHALEWARLPGDVLFILGGAIPLCWMCVRAVRYPNPNRQDAEVPIPEELFTRVQTAGR